MRFDARALERLRSKRCGRVIQDERQAGADPESVHPASNEFAA
jgi:hypothetical protein